MEQQNRSENLYERLGVEPEATQNEIKKAFRKLASAWHPDIISDELLEEHGGAEECEDIFRGFVEANEILSDDSLRRRYDMSGSTTKASLDELDYIIRKFMDLFIPHWMRQPNNPNILREIRKKLLNEVISCEQQLVVFENIIEKAEATRKRYKKNAAKKEHKYSSKDKLDFIQLCFDRIISDSKRNVHATEARKKEIQMMLDIFGDYESVEEMFANPLLRHFTTTDTSTSTV